MKSPHIIHDVWKRSFGAEDSGRLYTTVFHNAYYCKPKASCQSSNSKHTMSQNSLYCIPAAWLDSQIAPRLRLDGFKSLKRHTTRIISHPKMFYNLFSCFQERADEHDLILDQLGRKDFILLRILQKVPI